MNVLSLFDGISCGKVALNLAGIGVKKYYASEIDKYAIAVSKFNHPDIIHLGDISKWHDWKLPKIDLIIGGSPCQGFSFAGKQLNFDDPRSKLVFDYVDIVKQYKPIYFLLENVVMNKQSQQVITDLLGVEPVKINSDRFICQNRNRLYWTNIPINTLPKRPNWDNTYYQYRRTYMRQNKSGVCPTLTANMGTGGHNVPLQKIIESGAVDRETSFCITATYGNGGTLKEYYDKSKRQLVFNGDRYRKLTPVECERLQGLPDNYTSCNGKISNTQRYKMIGNGWNEPTVVHIFQGLKRPNY